MPSEKYKLTSFTILGVLYLLLFVPIVAQSLEPVPYTDVKEKEVVWSEDGVTIKYGFVKSKDCHLVTFHVEGSFAGVYIPLDYVDLDGFSENYDRSPGSQSLNIRVLIDGQSPESIRLHTRHDCDSTMVNKVFTQADNPKDAK